MNSYGKRYVRLHYDITGAAHPAHAQEREGVSVLTSRKKLWIKRAMEAKSAGCSICGLPMARQEPPLCSKHQDVVESTASAVHRWFYACVYTECRRQRRRPNSAQSIPAQQSLHHIASKNIRDNALAVLRGPVLRGGEYIFTPTLISELTLKNIARSSCTAGCMHASV